MTLLLVLLVAQGAIGYIQYFNDIPAFLVGVHVAGATAVWSATLMLFLGMYEHAPAPARHPLAPPDPPELVRCRHRSASTGRGTSREPDELWATLSRTDATGVVAVVARSTSRATAALRPGGRAS